MCTYNMVEAKRESKGKIQSRNWKTIKRLGNLDELKWSDRKRFTDEYVADLRARAEGLQDVPDVKERKRRGNRTMENEIKRLGNKLEFKLDGTDTKLKLELTRAAGIDNSRVVEFYVNNVIDKKNIPLVVVEASRSNKPYYLQVGENIINLNGQSGKTILRLYKGLSGIATFQQGGSDALNVISEYVKFNNPILKLRDEEVKAPEQAGARFNYYNKSQIDLRRYQIFTEDEKIDNQHCLVYALSQLGFKRDILNEVSLCIPNTALKKKHLRNIATLIKADIALCYFRGDGTKRSTIYKTPYNATVYLALYCGHYFVYEKTNYSLFFTNNYEECMKHKQPHKIIKFDARGRAKRSADRKADSLMLIKNFMKAKLFKPFTKLSKMEKKITFDLSNIDAEQRLFKNDVKEPKARAIFYADVESDVSGDRHKFLMGGIVDQKSENVFITRKVDNMFDYVVENSGENLPVVYFHNLKYDAHVIGRFLQVIGSLEKDGQMYTMKIMHKKKMIVLKDSYKLIPRRLSDFKKMFNLDFGKKEAINYGAYRVGMDDFYSIKKYRKGLRPEERKIFDEEYKKFEVRGSKFNAMAYYKHYLEMDVLTLRAGLEKMNKCILKITDDTIDKTNTPMCLYDYNTISSLGHHWAVNKGCYDGLYEVRGGLRHFLSQAIYGGRVNVNIKYEKRVIKGKIQDFDGVSLYPSAMNRLARESGLPIGKCYRFEDEIPNCDYYVAKIRLNAINKKQQNPFIALRTSEGLKYVNEISEPQEMIVDKITLEDYEKFHKIEYDVLEGVYWNKGFNNKIGCIRELFEARLNFKKEKNEPMQQTVKLIMNSIYGKSITKKSDKKISYKPNNKQGITYLRKNYETIISATMTPRWIRIVQSTIDLSYNLSVVGSSILSMSKRIMNEVMGSASEFNIPIMYQDTDSMHMFDRDVKSLAKLYKAQYNKELIGKNLEQFHCDFSMKGCKEVHSTGSIFLGKKAYVDRILGDGKKVEYHIRLKGVNNASIQDQVAKKGFDNPFQLYEHLLKHPTKFCLNFDKHHVNFVYGNGSVRTMRTGTFNRVVDFTQGRL